MAVFMAAFSFIGCNQSNPQSTAEHQEAVELTETMQLSHKGMEEKLDFLKTENKDFKRKVNELKNPTDSLENTIALQDSLINDFEKMCREQKRLIDENEDIIKKHERRAIDPAKMAEEHKIILENYEKLQLQAAAVVQEVENIKIRIEGANITEHK